MRDGQPADLTATWVAVQAALPEGWVLDGLRCASTGLGVSERSADWVAVALGPRGEQLYHRAPDPIAALRGLVGVGT